MKNSVTCPPFLINPCTRAIFSGAHRGKRKERTGMIRLDVFSAENEPVDIKDMMPTQRMTGSQFLIT